MKNKKEQSVVKRSLLSWLSSSSLKLQLLLLIIIVVIVFLRVLPLELQKRIINDVLSRKDTDLLIYYCLIYLGAVVLTSLLKFVINWLQTVISQQAMKDMRQQLYSHILRLPLSVFRKVQPGVVTTSLITELVPAANIVGMAIAIPFSNILTLLAFGAYLLWLNPLLAAITLMIYPITLFVIPLVQRGANRANKDRVDSTRKVANQITESVFGVHEVHAHGSFWTEEKKYNSLIERLYHIRITWMLYRYGVKVINNLFLSLGPVIVFLLGGYLLIQGKIELGSIIAFLSAQEKLYAPWKELIDFYQVYQDASVRYKKSMTSFDYQSEFIPLKTSNQAHDFSGRVEIKNLEFSPSKGIKILDQVNLTVEGGEHLALVGFSGSGKSTLAKCIGQLCNYTKGEILLDGYALSSLSKQEVVNTVGFISQSSFIFSGTVNDNLLYTYHAIDDQPQKENELAEPDLDDKISVVQQTGLFTDILRFGLNTIIDRSLYPGLEEKILRLRRSFQEDFEEELADHVEFFNTDKFLYQSSIVENIIFGSPLKREYAFDQLVKNKPFITFLDSCGLRLALLETGAEIIRQTIDILGEHPEDELFFAQTPIRSEEYSSCVELSVALKEQTISDLSDSAKSLLLDLALRFTPHAHKIIALQPLLESLILTGRKGFHAWCLSNEPSAVSFYEADRYISSQSILSNIFYGNLSDNSPAIEERVNQCIVFLLVQEDLLEQVAAIGLEFDVGNKGDKLSGGQQQKLAIARVLLKHPKILIMDEATSALDNDSQRRIQKIVESWKGQCTVIAVIHRLDMLPSFDKVAVMKAGKIVESGEPDELTSRKGVLNELLHGKRR